MTEIPEHLLKRSKERRAAASGGPAGETAEAGATASTAPATVAAATPAAAAPAKPAAPAAPPPPKPDPAFIAAAKSRKKIPFWAMATLSLLPIWGFLYVQGIKPEAKTVSGPIGVGLSIYPGSCAGCHGANGEGGAGRPFINGAVVTTFPHIEDQLNLVYTGSQAYRDELGQPYGAPSAGRIGGYNGSFMPAQKSNLSEAEILAVVCHVRYDLGGASADDPAYAEEFAEWCSEDSEIYAGLQDGSLTFDNLAEQAGTLPVGTEPRPGSEADAAG